MNKKLKGFITFSRPHSNKGTFPEITIGDRTSGCIFLEIKMTMEDFAQAILGLGHVDCEFETYNLNLIGLKREVKIERVNRPQSNDKNKEERDWLLKPFEIDGWKAYDQDLYNRNKWIKGENTVEVSFTRFVENKEVFDEA